jgi:4-amino-4-deoxy-L-arabinose transferase-like glycosyltransferase
MMGAVLEAQPRSRRWTSAPRRVLRGIPRAAVVCAALAALNAACWSIVTPPFQVPDEPEHFAYVKQLAETGRLPTSSSGALSPEELVTLTSLHFEQVRDQPEHGTISSSLEQDELQREIARAARFPEKGSPSAGVATQEPPLYYALQVLPYELGSGATLLGHLELMRLLSALLGGFTALFVFLFIRELLPAFPWAWTVGALGVALAPLLGFMSGSVNPDALLFAVSAAVFYCLARAFRRGLTPRLALLLGAVTATGFLTKLNFIGLAPGVLLGMVVLAMRLARISGARAAWRSLAIALVLALSPIAVFVAIHLAAGRPLLGVVSSGVDTTRGSLLGELGYMWQLYLPRLPGMSSDFPGIFTARQIWFDGYVGLYGWLDTPFPGWVYDVALVPAAAIAILCLRTLLACRAALRARIAELVVYLAMGVGLLLLIGADSYRSFPEVSAEYGQARYLLPLLPLFGAVLALAARGAGRRWGPVVGAAIVVLFFGHDLFSQLQVVARYYG